MPRPAQIQALIPWFECLRDFRSERSRVRLGEFKRKFQRLGEALLPLQERAAGRARVETPDFNVFRILRLSRREVRTHTPFLTNLLNPVGTHAQGELFLRIFWERLAAKCRQQPGRAMLPPFVAGHRWTVLAEQVTDLGNFDIHLRCPGMRCQLVIENKIDAADQEDQLARYWAQMEKERVRFPHRFLVYLTPQPREPEPTKLPLPPFTNLTYCTDIIDLLQMALAEITSPRLSHSLEQYLEITRAL
jgi:hypothetical protein